MEFTTSDAAKKVTKFEVQPLLTIDELFTSLL